MVFVDLDYCGISDARKCWRFSSSPGGECRSVIPEYVDDKLPCFSRKNRCVFVKGNTEVDNEVMQLLSARPPHKESL